MAKDDPKSPAMGNAIGNAGAAQAGGASISDLRPQIDYTDLREWIEEARKLGEICEVKGLSWQADIGAAAEVVLHDENAPCIVFEDIPGTLAGSRVLVNFFGGRRQRMTLGFPLHLSKLELSEAFREHYMADLRRIAPRYVNDGPVFENVITGDKVDTTIFPAPKWHPDDGGRYIGTGSFNVTRDPDEGWINCGTYRVMIHDRQTVGFYISPGKHGRIQRDKYEARKEPMPVAIVVGCDPMSFLMASSEVPYGVCAARRAHRAGAQGQGRFHQQPGDHRRLPALALARQVPQGECAVAGGGAPGAIAVRVFAQVKNDGGGKWFFTKTMLHLSLVTNCDFSVVFVDA